MNNNADRNYMIARLRSNGVDPRTIADSLGLHVSTVYRAIKADQSQEDSMTDERPMTSADKIINQFRRPQHEIDAEAERIQSNLDKVRQMERSIFDRAAELKRNGMYHGTALKQASAEYWERVEAEKAAEAGRAEAEFRKRQAYRDSDAGQLEELSAHLDSQTEPITSAQKLRRSFLERRVAKTNLRTGSDYQG